MTFFAAIEVSNLPSGDLDEGNDLDGAIFSRFNIVYPNSFLPYTTSMAIVRFFAARANLRTYNSIHCFRILDIYQLSVEAGTPRVNIVTPPLELEIVFLAHFFPEYPVCLNKQTAPAALPDGIPSEWPVAARARFS